MSEPLDLVRARAAEAGDAAYGDFVASKPFAYYRRRVQELGLADRGRVLDVGCGYGHWTAALALENDEAVGIDRSGFRIAIAEELAADLGLVNTRFDVGDAAVLPYEDEAFDAVVCYSVFMFLDRDQALRELRRVLVPGGRLYVNTAARGWWLRLWLRSLRGPASRRSSALHGLLGRDGTPPHATSRRAARRLLRVGWTGIESNFDDRIGRAAGETREPPYAPRFAGIDAVVEFVADKAGAEATASVLDRADISGGRSSYEYATPLQRLPQPRPAVDLVGNCDPRAIRRALAHARVADRLEVLQRLYTDLTSGAVSDDERVTRCVTFAQLHFFHHFAGQPMVDGRPVQDPIASLLLEVGRCGASAAFLVDLFGANGLDARLAGGAAHTWAEVSCGGRWVIADANLFPPGILPRDRSGALLTTEAAAADPALLDRTPSYVNYHYEYIDAFLGAYPETEASIGHWLRWPLLPSSGYFGRALFANGEVVQRSRKNGTPAEWDDEPAFGWSSLTSTALPVRGTELEQRPSQVRDLRVDGDAIVWTPATTGDGAPVRYRVVVSDAGRGWEYDALPVGCTFDVPGEAILVDQPCVPLARVPAGAQFATVIAEKPAWDGRDVFYLPSRELRLG